MTGSASQAMDVVFWLSEAFQRRGPERRYMSRFRPTGPWRMTGSAFQVMDVVLRVAKRFQRRGPERRYMSRSRPTGPWRMTGSASQAMDVMLLSTEGIPEERYGEEIDVAVRSY